MHDIILTFLARFNLAAPDVKFPADIQPMSF